MPLLIWLVGWLLSTFITVAILVRIRRESVSTDEIVITTIALLGWPFTVPIVLVVCSAVKFARWVTPKKKEA